MEIVWSSSQQPSRKRVSQDICYHGNSDLIKTPAKAAVPGVEELPTLNLDVEEPTEDPSPHEYSPEYVLERPVASQFSASQAAQEARNQSIWDHKYRQRPSPEITSSHYQKYLEQVGAFLKLPISTTNALLPIYNALLDDLIPIVDGSSVIRAHSNGQCSPYLVRAICLVICKARQAGPFLQIDDDGPILKAGEFASTLLSGLDAAIKADLEPDRIIRIQILSLMHLYNDEAGGVERASVYLSQAICEAWSISLHLRTPSKPDQDECDFLWWSLRNLDRLSKPITRSKPFMIDDTDIGLPRTRRRKDGYRSQVMSVALTLGDLMATATKAYKASYRATIDGCQEFPSFADVLGDITFANFHRSHKAYLEVWYHLAAMLSCRHSGPGSVQYNRRLLSADRILTIFTNEECGNLPPLPLLPYAMSMSTTVIYRAWRDVQRDLDITYRDLCRCCDVLDRLSEQWTNARGVAKLATDLRVTIKSRRTEPYLETRPSVDAATSSPKVAVSMQDHRSEAAPNSNELTDSDGQIIEDFWTDLERACVHFDTSFDDLLDYPVFGDSSWS
ncbi:hypothetical protein BJY01DRAFT_232942 [Aspergillus pseudoustus]|uniref:Transcription factor domain-containing protein n=1 Tax=Aspergillus pseudoustus TaxID=1810923 RepID=A0ABR4KGX0_9EURO